MFPPLTRPHLANHIGALQLYDDLFVPIANHDDRQTCASMQIAALSGSQNGGVGLRKAISITVMSNGTGHMIVCFLDCVHCPAALRGASE